VGALPAQVIAKAKLCILDTIGCMLVGSRDRVGMTVAKHAVRRGSSGGCTVFGHPETLGAADAALANGTAAHVLDWDDGHRPSGDHIGGAVVPPAFAMAQETRASGAALVLAVTLGYDVMGRIGESVALPRGPQRFFHGNGVNGVFGAAAAAGKLLDLPNGAMANALAIAGDGASGLREFRPTGADVKALHVGRAGQTGISAAYLASEGLQGAATILEGRLGFCAAISPEPRPERICADLGQRFAVLESGFKVYPCVGTLHLPIEAALSLRKEHAIDPGSIEAIRVFLPTAALENYGGSVVGRQRHPTTVGNARFSMYFTIAAALRDGEVTPRQFTPAKISDPEIAKLADQIEFRPDSEIEAIFRAQKTDEPFFFTPCALEVDTGGKTYKRLVRTPPGYDQQQRGLTEAQIVAKFHSIADEQLSVQRADRLVALVLGLEHLADLTEISNTLGTLDGLGATPRGATP
jgi:2-methylcitrate dehydratase PrpD